MFNTVREHNISLHNFNQKGGALFSSAIKNRGFIQRANSMSTYKKKKTVSTTVKKKKVTRGYEIDGIRYKSKALVEMHKQLDANPLVKRFSLPSVRDEAEHNSGKYRAKECYINGNHFDSLMEAQYYVFLLKEQKAGKIKYFSMQESFELQPSFVNKFTGRSTQSINYVADYVIVYLDDSIEVIDVKGKETPEFKIKKKLFEYMYPDIYFKCLQYDTKKKEWIDLHPPTKAMLKKIKNNN